MKTGKYEWFANHRMYAVCYTMSSFSLLFDDKLLTIDDVDALGQGRHVLQASTYQFATNGIDREGSGMVIVIVDGLDACWQGNLGGMELDFLDTGEEDGPVGTDQLQALLRRVDHRAVFVRLILRQHCLNGRARLGDHRDGDAAYRVGGFRGGLCLRRAICGKQQRNHYC